MFLKKKYCLFPKPQFNHFLFLFYFASAMVKQYIFRFIKNTNDNIETPFFKLYVHELGDLLSIIPYLILKKKTKSNNDTKLIYNNNDNDIKENSELIYNDYKIVQFKKKQKGIILNLLIISLLDFIAQISTVVFYLIEGNQKLEIKTANLNTVLIFNIIFLFLLTKFLLDKVFYIYHYFSFVIFIICLIVIAAIDFMETIKGYKELIINSFLYMVIRIFSVLLYSIEYNQNKAIFLKYYYSPYLLLLTKAVIQFFFLIIFSFPLFFVKFTDGNGKKKIIFAMLSNIFIHKIAILLYIIYLINSFFYSVIKLHIIDKFSPTHLSIAFISETFANFIIITIIDKVDIDYKFVIRFVMYILLIIASCIFNEIWVINLCGFANNTKLFLDYKEQADLILIDQVNIGKNSEITLSEAEIEENIRTSSIRGSTINNNIELTEL